jgi:hypothetical protein
MFHKIFLLYKAGFLMGMWGLDSYPLGCDTKYSYRSGMSNSLFTRRRLDRGDCSGGHDTGEENNFLLLLIPHLRIRYILFLLVYSHKHKNVNFYKTHFQFA